MELRRIVAFKFVLALAFNILTLSSAETYYLHTDNSEEECAKTVTVYANDMQIIKPFKYTEEHLRKFSPANCDLRFRSQQSDIGLTVKIVSLTIPQCGPTVQIINGVSKSDFTSVLFESPVCDTNNPTYSVSERTFESGQYVYLSTSRGSSTTHTFTITVTTANYDANNGGDSSIDVGIGIAIGIISIVGIFAVATVVCVCINQKKKWAEQRTQRQNTANMYSNEAFTGSAPVVYNLDSSTTTHHSDKPLRIQNGGPKVTDFGPNHAKRNHVKRGHGSDSDTTRAQIHNHISMLNANSALEDDYTSKEVEIIIDGPRETVHNSSDNIRETNNSGSGLQNNSRPDFSYQSPKTISNTVDEPKIHTKNERPEAIGHHNITSYTSKYLPPIKDVDTDLPVYEPRDRVDHRTNFQEGHQYKLKGYSPNYGSREMDFRTDPDGMNGSSFEMREHQYNKQYQSSDSLPTYYKDLQNETRLNNDIHTKSLSHKNLRMESHTHTDIDNRTYNHNVENRLRNESEYNKASYSSLVRQSPRTFEEAKHFVTQSSDPYPSRRTAISPSSTQNNPYQNGRIGPRGLGPGFQPPPGYRPPGYSQATRTFQEKVDTSLRQQ